MALVDCLGCGTTYDDSIGEWSIYCHSCRYVQKHHLLPLVPQDMIDTVKKIPEKKDTKDERN